LFEEREMPYELKPLSCNPSGLNGLSEKLIVSHWENNYGGAVKRLNAIEQKLAELQWASAPVFEINGLKREEMIASGSMILHEVYFDSLGGAGGDPSGQLKAAIERDFGTLDAWRAEFTAMGKAQGGGSGWTLLVWSPRRGRLVNAWAADHAHNLAGATPLIALDMYEHSYHMDFGAKAGAYVDAFMQNLSWTAAEAAFATLGA
jgi:superoxide dismutase, Fe-Mn family